MERQCSSMLGQRWSASEHRVELLKLVNVDILRPEEEQLKSCLGKPIAQPDPSNHISHR